MHHNLKLKGLEDFYNNPRLQMNTLQSGANGEILHIFHLKKQYLLKLSSSKDHERKNRIKKEANGLITLKKNGLTTPKLYKIHPHYLLMEYIEPGNPLPSRLRDAGSSLAKIHRIHKEKPGYIYDNFIGRLKQFNRTDDTNIQWPQFFTKYRIQKYLQMLPSAKKDSKFWEKFLQKLPDLIPNHPISLIHGDLWAGNMLSGKKGYVFIDPAVQYADRYMDIAMTKLFGGFGKEFYEGYNEIYPIEKEYWDWIKLYQLYYILVHAVLFGESYYLSAKRTASEYT